MIMRMPTWLTEVSQDSGVNARDVLSMFGYKNKQKLDREINSGNFPEADRWILNTHNAKTRIWAVRTIRNKIIRRNKTP